MDVFWYPSLACAKFFQVAPPQQVIGTTLCFESLMDWRSVCLFDKFTHFVVSQVVPITSIGAVLQTCTHPSNHRHYPIVWKFEGLKNNFQISRSPYLFSKCSGQDAIPPSPPAKFVFSVGGGCVFFAFHCLNPLVDRTKLWPILNFLVWGLTNICTTCSFMEVFWYPFLECANFSNLHHHNNHGHYPMVCKFGGPKKYFWFWQFHTFCSQPGGTNVLYVANQLRMHPPQQSQPLPYVLKVWRTE